VFDACQKYSWPGNLRELENFVKRYLVIGDEELALEELTNERANNRDGNLVTDIIKFSEPRTQNTPSLKTLVELVKEEAERNAITAALEQTRWNRKAAARLLKVSYRTLLYKIEQYHMSPPSRLPSPIGGEEPGCKGNGIS